MTAMRTTREEGREGSRRSAVVAEASNLWHTSKMVGEPSNDYRVDIRTIATILLRLSSVILVVIYVLEYTYAFRFLLWFRVTPEEVGISQIELLSRAALLTLFLFALSGVVLILVALGLGLVNFVARAIREKKRKARNRSVIEMLRRASRQQQVARIASTLFSALTIAGLIVLTGYIGSPLDIISALIYVGLGILVTSVLFVGWRRNSTRYITFASGTLLAAFLLGSAAFSGGYVRGEATVKTGRIPTFINAAGVDIVQVYPEWMNKDVIPPNYTQGQDMLELGSNTETVYLYNCRTQTTYSIPVHDVILAYSIYDQSTASLRRLHCS
jgi:hypothetical protein